MPTPFTQFIAQRRCWTPLIAGLALAACGSGGADVAPAPAQTPAPPAQTQMQTLSVPAGYKLVWSDEFDRAGLPDPAKWVYDTGMNKQGWHNKELQYYSHARAKNSAVQDGKLIITARLEAMDKQADWGGQRYSSARLITAGKADWTYGFFEIRAKLPCGKGSWPAIWMLASQGEWPAGGELDIMEQIGNEPTKVFSTVHTTAGSGAHGKGGETQVADACSAFHNYQMHWTAEGVRFGIDGKPHAVYPNPKTGKAAWPFDAPQFLILNIAIGGDLGGAVDDAALPIRMEVEHVRVYQQAQ